MKSYPGAVSGVYPVCYRLADSGSVLVDLTDCATRTPAILPSSPDSTRWGVESTLNRD